MTEELLYAREYASEDERSQAIAIGNAHYNYHRPHSTAGSQPPASRLKTRVINVRPHTARRSIAGRFNRVEGGIGVKRIGTFVVVRRVVGPRR
jgi:hypothetical protein